MRRLALGVLLVASHAAAEPASIIGGTTTTVGQFPSVVGVRVGLGLCTGTLIDRQWVLTAAHCITPSIVGLADQATVTARTTVHFNTVNLNASPGVVVGAAATFPKPGFGRDTLGKDDVGLIMLEQTIESVAPTPVNLDAALAPIGTTATMVGYGATAASGGGSVGVQFMLMGRTSTACSAYRLLDANLLCFSQTDNKGKCVGDSGGPSFAQVGGVTTVVGVTSFGDENCAIFNADSRTDVERPFLLEHIPALVPCDEDADCTADHVCFQTRCIKTPFSTGALGSTCRSTADCEAGECADGPDGKHCTQKCARGTAGSCPDGLECIEANSGGACWPEGAGGCCDTSGRGAPTMVLGIGAILVAWRRRRSR